MATLIGLVRWLSHAGFLTSSDSGAGLRLKGRCVRMTVLTLNVGRVAGGHRNNPAHWPRRIGLRGFWQAQILFLSL
jgi:hypothetical protein